VGKSKYPKLHTMTAGQISHQIATFHEDCQYL